MKGARLSLSLVLIAIGIGLAAQTAYVDVVVTKDGNTYKGVLLENRLGDYVKIEIAGGSIIKVDYSNIVALNKEEAQGVSAQGLSAQVAAVPPQPSPDLSEGAFDAAQSRLSGLSRAELRSIDLGDLGIKSWASADRKRLYNGLRKTNAPGAFVLNLLLPFGIGSYIQGDTTTGTYQLLSSVGLVVASVTGIMYKTVSTAGADGYYEETELTAAGCLIYINYLAAYADGLVSPWLFQHDYNQELQKAIGP